MSLKTFLSLSLASATCCETKPLTACWEGMVFETFGYFILGEVSADRGCLGFLLVLVEMPTVRSAAPKVSFASPRHPSCWLLSH